MPQFRVACDSDISHYYHSPKHAYDGKGKVCNVVCLGVVFDFQEGGRPVAGPATWTLLMLGAGAALSWRYLISR
jgi:hypothetical protein